MEKHLKVIGIYVAAICVAHLCLYVVLNLCNEKFGRLFYFDTRIGFFFIESVIRHSESTPPAITAWLVELGELALAIAMISGRRLVKVYVILETILTIPYLLFAVLILAAGMGANHGFSPAELFLPTIVVIVSSVIPLAYGFWILWCFRPPDHRVDRPLRILGR